MPTTCYRCRVPISADSPTHACQTCAALLTEARRALHTYLRAAVALEERGERTAAAQEEAEGTRRR